MWAIVRVFTCLSCPWFNVTVKTFCEVLQLIMILHQMLNGHRTSSLSCMTQLYSTKKGLGGRGFKTFNHLTHTCVVAGLNPANCSM